MTKSSSEPKAGTGKVFGLAFWGTIGFLAVLTLAMSLAAQYRPAATIAQVDEKAEEDACAPGSPDLAAEADQAEAAARTRLEAVFLAAAQAAEASVERDGIVQRAVSAAYAPAYTAVPKYAAFHYSVFGEYSELGTAAFGDLQAMVHEKLFSGLDARIKEAAVTIDRTFDEAWKAEVSERLGQDVANDPCGGISAEDIDMIVGDAVSRMKVTAPLASVAAVTGGAASIKVISSVVAKKIATKVAAKAAAKGVMKAGGIGSGATAGAAIGAFGGPVGMAVGGVVGGAVSWFIADAVVVNLDEYFNRDEFEAELRKMIRDEEDKTLRAMTDALKTRAQTTPEVVSLQDLATTGQSD